MARTPRPRKITPSRVNYHRVALVALRDAKIYKRHPSGSPGPGDLMFPGISFSLDSASNSKERWAVVSKDASAIRTRFLQILQGHFICIPPVARDWPYLSSDAYKESHQGQAGNPSRMLRYVGFSNSGAGSGSSGTKGAYLGSRYESRREDTDWSLLDYLRGTVSLNLSDKELAHANKLERDETFPRVIKNLKLEELLELPVGNLSNGQTRRARIAKALLEKPEMLLLDEPFAGIDPFNHRILSGLLRDLAEESTPRVLLSLQATELIPDWITHLVHLSPTGAVLGSGEKSEVLEDYETLYLKAPRSTKRAYEFSDPERQANLEENRKRGRGTIAQFKRGIMHLEMPEFDKVQIMRERDPDFVVWDSYDGFSQDESHTDRQATPLVEMNGVKVSYGTQCVLGNWRQETQGSQKEGLHWTVRSGERWGVFGANGSGKTTLISLLTSDHPQAYSLPIKVFGKSRLPTASEPGVSIFDLQKRIGHSSPEVHTHFPKHLLIRDVIENAWADAFLSRANLSYEDDEKVSSALRWFRHELDPAATSVADPVESHFGRGIWQARLVEKWNTKGPQDHYTKWLTEEPEWADKIRFSELSVSAQRVALFLRAVIKKPDIVVLDEAFSGMDEYTRVKCMMWLAHGEEKWLHRPTNSSGRMRPKVDTPMKDFGLLQNTGLEPRQAVVCVSHRKEEVPFVVNKWLHLPEANEGKSVRFGEIDRANTRDWWENIWSDTNPSFN